MTWLSVTDFLAMGGYGLYVWGSVVTVFAGIIGEALVLSRHRARLLNEIGRAS